MEKNFRQVRLDEWHPNDNLPIAQISIELEELETLLGITFEDSHDDLDYMKIAVIELQEGLHMAMVRYRGKSVKVVDLWSSNRIASVESDLRRFFAATGLDPSTMYWKRPPQQQ